ncbi:MAG: sigma-70 family RNA polymerase sigma factor [Acidobacteria bacterium]|nr:sigma-70 family RNA polymerase sigma factor [Acidobacteriota bacterium]
MQRFPGESRLLVEERQSSCGSGFGAQLRLPPRYRLPLTLFHLDGLSHSKVAEALGVSVSTARSLVTRARQKLQPMLASYAGEVLPALEDVFREQTIGESAMLHMPCI